MGHGVGQCVGQCGTCGAMRGGSCEDVWDNAWGILRWEAIMLWDNAGDCGTCCRRMRLSKFAFCPGDLHERADMFFVEGKICTCSLSRGSARRRADVFFVEGTCTRKETELISRNPSRLVSDRSENEYRREDDRSENDGCRGFPNIFLPFSQAFFAFFSGVHSDLTTLYISRDESLLQTIPTNLCCPTDPISAGALFSKKQFRSEIFLSVRTTNLELVLVNHIRSISSGLVSYFSCKENLENESFIEIEMI